jgi:stage III sporulation protein SpoIIIAA
MAGTISLLNQDGDRLHTIYVGSAPESGKKTFLWKMRKELSAVIKEFPKATVVGVADAPETIGSF